MSSSEQAQNERALRLESGAVNYTVRRSRRAKRISLRITEHRGLELVLPPKTCLEHGVSFMKQKADWIRKHQPRLEAARRQQSEVATLPAMAPFRGRDYPVRIHFGNSKRVEFSGTDMRVLAPDAVAARAAMVRWFQNRARILIPERVRELAAGNSAASIRRISIRDQRTRWGSCSARGTLSFNWRLVMMPPDVLDYVVVHELIHFTHQHHQRAFWEALNDVMPDYKRRKQWLKTSGERLLKEWPPANSQASEAGYGCNREPVQAGGRGDVVGNCSTQWRA